MRNISFALTTLQVRAQSKTVTRRVGWKLLKPGDLLQPIVKGQGIRKGEHVEKIGAPIRVVSVTRERLDRLRYADADVVAAELRAEGVTHSCDDWQDFLRIYFWPQGCQPDTEVTRIEFEYTSAPPRPDGPVTGDPR